MSVFASDLKRICPLTYIDVPLAPYTTFKIGGKASALCDVRSLNELKELIIYLNKNHIPYVVLGKGSNVLVSDSGFNGVVIRLKGEFEKIVKDGSFLKVGAGVKISSLLRYCLKNMLGGLEFLVCIPGTVGGATVMNAGAFNGHISDRIVKVGFINKDAKLLIKEISQLSFSYRHMHIEDGCIVVYVWLSLDPTCRKVIKDKILNYVRIRKKTQPVGVHSAGCIFKNPKRDYAGRLIEELGFKGLRIGGALVSDIHANFIINQGNATSSDVMALINKIKRRIKEEKGIELEPEIRFIGFCSEEEKKWHKQGC